MGNKVLIWLLLVVTLVWYGLAMYTNSVGHTVSKTTVPHTITQML